MSGRTGNSAPLHAFEENVSRPVMSALAGTSSSSLSPSLRRLSTMPHHMAQLNANYHKTLESQQLSARLPDQTEQSENLDSVRVRHFCFALVFLSGGSTVGF